MLSAKDTGREFSAARPDARGAEVGSAGDLNRTVSRIAQSSSKKLDAFYREACCAGLKTTYYLRSSSATHVEKSTLKRTDGKLNEVALAPKQCAIDDPTCEACH